MKLREAEAIAQYVYVRRLALPSVLLPRRHPIFIINDRQRGDLLVFGLTQPDSFNRGTRSSEVDVTILEDHRPEIAWSGIARPLGNDVPEGWRYNGAAGESDIGLFRPGSEEYRPLARRENEAVLESYRIS